MQRSTFQSIIRRDIHPLESAMFDAIDSGNHDEAIALIPLIEKRAAQSAANQHGPSFAFAKGDTGFTFLHVALDRRREKIASDLLTYYLTMRTQPEWSTLHLDPIWIVAKPRKHVLSLAAQAGYDDIVCTLINNAENCRFYFTDTFTSSENISPFEVNSEFQPPLIDIVKNCNIITLKKALNYIAQLPLSVRILDQRNNPGQTAFYIACLIGDADKAELLLRYGASSTIAANGGRLPLQSVAEDEKAAFTDYLTQSGVFIRNNQPPTSIDFEDADQTQRILAHGKLALTSTTRDATKKTVQEFYYPFTAQLSLKQALIAKLETDSQFIEKVIQLVTAKKISFQLPADLHAELPLLAKGLISDIVVREDQDADLESVLTKNHRDLTALIEQFTEIDEACADLIKQRFEFLRSGEFVGASIATAALFFIFCFALDFLIRLFSNHMMSDGGFLGFLAYIISFMTSIFSPIIIGFLVFDICRTLINDLVIHEKQEPFPVAKFILEKLFCTEGRYQLPLSNYADIHKQLQLLTDDLVTLLKAYRETIQFNPNDLNANELQRYITELQDNHLTLIRAQTTVKRIISCLEEMDRYTIERDKKPIKWDFFKKPSLKSAQESDDTVTLVRSDIQAVVVI